MRQHAVEHSVITVPLAGLTLRRVAQMMPHRDPFGITTVVLIKKPIGIATIERSPLNEITTLRIAIDDVITRLNDSIFQNMRHGAVQVDLSGLDELHQDSSCNRLRERSNVIWRLGRS